MYATVLAGRDQLVDVRLLPMSMFVKTLKYLPDSPERFGCIEYVRACCADLITSYV